MKAIINWFSKNENAQNALFLTIVVSIVTAFIACIALILKYGTVINLA